MKLPQASIAISSDIVDSSTGGYPRHADLLRALEDAVGAGIGEGPYRDGWIRSNRGDAELTLAPSQVPSAWVLAEFLPRVRETALDYNRNKADGHRLRLRVGVDCGDVLFSADGEPRGGDPLVVAARLRDCEAANQAISLVPSAPVVAVVSDPMYQRAIPYGASGLAPHMFRRVPVRVPGKKFAAVAWLYVPGHPPPALPGDDPGMPPSDPDPEDLTGEHRRRPPASSDSGGAWIDHAEFNGPTAVGPHSKAVNKGGIQIRRPST